MENQRAFCDFVARDIGFDPLDDESWYNITVNDFKRRGGERFLQRYYRSSVFALLSNVYPDLDWKPWRFKKAQNLASSDKISMEKLFIYLADKFDVKSKEEWGRVSDHKLKALKVRSFVERAGGKDAFFEKYAYLLTSKQ
jgi:hypothetical protein